MNNTEKPVEVDAFEVDGHRMEIRHFAPRFDTIQLDTIHCADGPVHVARLGQNGYAVHEPLFPASQPQNRAGRRAARRLARRR